MRSAGVLAICLVLFLMLGVGPAKADDDVIQDIKKTLRACLELAEKEVEKEAETDKWKRWIKDCASPGEIASEIELGVYDEAEMIRELSEESDDIVRYLERAIESGTEIRLMGETGTHARLLDSAGKKVAKLDWYKGRWYLDI